MTSLGFLRVPEVEAQLFEEHERDDGLGTKSHESGKEALKTKCETCTEQREEIAQVIVIC